MRPYKSLHVSQYYNGRLPLDTHRAPLQRLHVRASLHFATRFGTSTNRFASCFAKILRDSSYQQLSVYVQIIL